MSETTTAGGRFCDRIINDGRHQCRFPKGHAGDCYPHMNVAPPAARPGGEGTREQIDAVLRTVEHLPCEVGRELLAFRVVLAERHAADAPTSAPCLHCDGTGSAISDDTICRACEGSGVEPRGGDGASNLGPVDPPTNCPKCGKFYQFLRATTSRPFLGMPADRFCECRPAAPVAGARPGGEGRTQFDYLLNAFEAASQHPQPSYQGYAEKRRALFDYVRRLERIAAKEGR